MSERLSSGIPGLDVMLHGGFLKGRNFLVSGPCGSGKTTIAMHFLVKGADLNEPGLFITLEESKDKLYSDMSKLGFDLHGLESKGLFRLIGGPLASVTSGMRKVNAKADDLLLEISEVVDEFKAKRVVIDSITLFTMLSSNLSDMRKSLASLCNVLSARGVTALLLSETKEGSFEVSKFGVEEFIVDGVVALYQVRQGPKFIPGIAVRKLRGSDHDREIRFFKITSSGVVVFPDQTLFSDV